MTIIDKPNTTGGQAGSSSQEHGTGVGIMAEQMMQDTAGKTIPAGYKQTEVGVIPEDWALLTIDDVASFSGGAQPAKTFFSSKPKDGYIRLIQIRDYKTSEYETYIPEALARKLCSEYDIMIGRYGPPIFQILKGIRGAYNVALIKAEPKKLIEREYLFYYLKTDKLFSLMDMLSQRSSGQTGVELPALKAYPIPLPPKQEQTAIANVLSDSDALIGSLEQLIAKKQAIKTGTMQQLLTGRTRLPAFALRPDGTKKGYKPSELGDIPEDWDVVEMAKIGSFGRGRVISHTEINKSYAKLYPVYSSQTSNDGVMGYLDSFNFDGEFVTWTTDGVNAGKVFYRNGKFNCTNVCGVIKIKDACARYVAIAMDQEARKYVSTNLANPKLMNGVAKQVLIRFPNDIEEQTAIATILSDMDNELQALTQKLEKARALKQGMMQQLLTGKIRLPLTAGA